MNENLTISNKNLFGYKQIKFEDIKKDEFVQDLLDKCLQNDILNNEDIDYINFGISKVLDQQLIYFTKNESSSINIDVAENLLMSVYFTISMSLKKSHNINEMIDRLKNHSIESIFKDGQRIIKRKYIKSKSILIKLKSSKMNIDNYSYVDTIDYGLDLFFNKYDYFFKAHEVPGDIDYQLSNDVFSYIGIEHIEKYIINLSYEETFCKCFDINEIKSLLFSYSDNSYELLLNVFDIVLTNSIGSFIAGNDCMRLNIKEYDKEIILNRIVKDYSENKLNTFINKYLCEIIKKLNITDYSFRTYIKRSLNKVKENFVYSINKGILKNEFVTFKEKNKQTLQYKPAPKLSNTQYKKVFEELLVLDKIDDKINVIKTKVKNIEDMIDILSSEVFMDCEYSTFFKSLDYFTLALILAYVPYIEDFNAYDETWHKEFAKYYLTVSQNTRNKIKEISKQIII